MDTSDDEGMQINLTDKDAAELAFQALQDDADSLILLLMGIKEQRTILAACLLIDAAIYEVVTLSSVYIELRDEYIRILVKKHRQK